MARKKNSIRPPLVKEHPNQPKKCAGCIWGRWEGTAQFCGRVKCQKENIPIRRIMMSKGGD
ncbi:hypothetical protein [Paenibacillus sp. FSL E2-0177]|uniref:hypothetical protein n=1 Tax=Paenibacillus sp. FSL E2-0177 TaxID=2921360 RepID=UPI0030EB8E6F